MKKEKEKLRNKAFKREGRAGSSQATLVVPAILSFPNEAENAAKREISAQNRDFGGIGLTIIRGVWI
ncbi:hypothetical protein V2J09_007524 [Rumex salicifolius]